MSRPSKIEDELLRKRILDGLRVGMSKENAAWAAGLNERTMYAWMARGRAGGESIYTQFYQDVMGAVALTERKYIEVIENAAFKGQWQAAAWLLERKFRGVWGKDPAEKKDEPDAIDLMSEEELVGKIREELKA